MLVARVWSTRGTDEEELGVRPRLPRRGRRWRPAHGEPCIRSIRRGWGVQWGAKWVRRRVTCFSCSSGYLCEFSRLIFSSLASLREVNCAVMGSLGTGFFTKVIPVLGELLFGRAVPVIVSGGTLSLS